MSLISYVKLGQVKGRVGEILLTFALLTQTFFLPNPSSSILVFEELVFWTKTLFMFIFCPAEFSLSLSLPYFLLPHTHIHWRFQSFVPSPNIPFFPSFSIYTLFCTFVAKKTFHTNKENESGKMTKKSEMFDRIEKITSEIRRRQMNWSATLYSLMKSERKRVPAGNKTRFIKSQRKLTSDFEGR